MKRISFLKLIGLTLLTGLSSAAVLAKPKPIYNVTGTWSGMSHSAFKKNGSSTLNAIFTADSPYSTFSGTLTTTSTGGTQGPQDFTIQGTVTRSGAFKATLTPVSGTGTANIKGTVNSKKNTITGTYLAKGQGNGQGDHGKFNISRTAE